MRVIYQRPRGQRVKKGTFKIKGRSKRVDIFDGLYSYSSLYWSTKLNKWIDSKNESESKYGYSSSNQNIKNLRSAIRHIKKHNEIPKGSKFVLESRLRGYSITIIK